MNAILTIDIEDDELGNILVPAGTRFTYDADREQQAIDGCLYYIKDGEFELEDVEDD